MSATTTEIKTSQGDLLRVSSQGAKIEVVLGGVPILGSFQRGDGKQGVTHPCTPIFGPDRKNFYGLKQHGNMRNEDVEVGQTDEGITVSHAITDEGYPKGITVRQKMNVADGIFIFEMTHTNTGNSEASVNAGEHCYFDAPQGYRGTTVNGQDITQLVEGNFDGTAIDLHETNTIQIPGKSEITLTQQGLRKAVVWVGKNLETKAIDQTYVCIEPVEDDPFGDFFGSKESMIAPGQSRTVRFKLQRFDK